MTNPPVLVRHLTARTLTTRILMLRTLTSLTAWEWLETHRPGILTVIDFLFLNFKTEDITIARTDWWKFFVTPMIFSETGHGLVMCSGWICWHPTSLSPTSRFLQKTDVTITVFPSESERKPRGNYPLFFQSGMQKRGEKNCGETTKIQTRRVIQNNSSIFYDC